MKNIKHLFYLLLFIPIILSSQLELKKNKEVESEIINHSNLKQFTLGTRQKVKEKKSIFVDGYRIQIYNGNNREEAMKIKKDFYQKFPNHRCYTLYQQPYYKVRVGDYMTPQSSKPDLKKMAKIYPSSFLVPEQIRRIENKQK